MYVFVDWDRIDDKWIVIIMFFLLWDRGVGGFYIGFVFWIIFLYVLNYLLGVSLVWSLLIFLFYGRKGMVVVICLLFILFWLIGVCIG